MTRPINLTIFNKTDLLCQVCMKRVSDRPFKFAQSDRQVVSLG
ncbi:hypothetical protein [Trichocoleus desertorum]